MTGLGLDVAPIPHALRDHPGTRPDRLLRSYKARSAVMFV